jgi:hypothetical protein
VLHGAAVSYVFDVGQCDGAMFESRPQKLGHDGQSDLTVKGKASIQW